MTLRAVRLWGRNISVPCFAIYRELLWIAAGLSDADSNLVSWRVKRRLMSQMLQAIRARLLASATAALLRCIRSDARANHSPKLKSGHRCGRIIMTFAAGTNSIRRYRLPRFEIRPRHLFAHRSARLGFTQ